MFSGSTEQLLARVVQEKSLKSGRREGESKKGQLSATPRSVMTPQVWSSVLVAQQVPGSLLVLPSPKQNRLKHES